MRSHTYENDCNTVCIYIYVCERVNECTLMHTVHAYRHPQRCASTGSLLHTHDTHEHTHTIYVYRDLLLHAHNILIQQRVCACMNVSDVQSALTYTCTCVQDRTNPTRTLHRHTHVQAHTCAGAHARACTYAHATRIHRFM